MVFRINEKMVKGVVKRIRPFVYGLSIKNDYDRAMLFCRYQEFYESPFSNIRGQKFSLEEYMRTYCEKNKSLAFTYPKDWGGFNIPSHSLGESIKLFFYDETHSASEYDIIMSQVYEFCKEDCYKIDGKEHKWYLIGYDDGDVKTLNHEMAHAYYYTNEVYRYNCNKLIQNIKNKDFLDIQKKLVTLGYRKDKKIIYDEIQAFMSTGLYSTMDTKGLRSYQNGFIENFENFHNNV